MPVIEEADLGVGGGDDNCTSKNKNTVVYSEGSKELIFFHQFYGHVFDQKHNFFSLIFEHLIWVGLEMGKLCPEIQKEILKGQGKKEFSTWDFGRK